MNLFALLKAHVHSYRRHQGGKLILVRDHERDTGATTEDPSQLTLFGGAHASGHVAAPRPLPKAPPPAPTAAESQQPSLMLPVSARAVESPPAPPETPSTLVLHPGPVSSPMTAEEDRYSRQFQKLLLQVGQEKAVQMVKQGLQNTLDFAQRVNNPALIDTAQHRAAQHFINVQSTAQAPVATPAPIPANVVRLVNQHAETVHQFNAEIVRVRQLGARLGDPGRYEFEYRETAQAPAEEAIEKLRQIEAMAPSHNVSLDQLYAQVPAGRPAGLMEPSEAARTWRSGPVLPIVPTLEDTSMMQKSRLILDCTKALHYRTRRHGLVISIEQRKNSIRRGVDAAGNAWATKMQHAYGYLPRTQGLDGEPVDCFVGPDPQATHVYIVTTMQPPDFTAQDEQKCMIGFPDFASAKAAFLAHYDDPRHLGNILEMPIEEFRSKVKATKAQPGAIQAV